MQALLRNAPENLVKQVDGVCSLAKKPSLIRLSSFSTRSALGGSPLL